MPKRLRSTQKSRWNELPWRKVSATDIEMPDTDEGDYVDNNFFCIEEVDGKYVQDLLKANNNPESTVEFKSKYADSTAVTAVVASEDSVVVKHSKKKAKAKKSKSDVEERKTQEPDQAIEVHVAACNTLVVDAKWGENISIHASLVNALSALHFQLPTPIQTKAIPATLAGSI